MRDGDGKRQPAQPNSGPKQPQQVATRVIDVGPPLVPRQSPPVKTGATSASSALDATAQAIRSVPIPADSATRMATRPQAAQPAPAPPPPLPPAARKRPEAPEVMTADVVAEGESLWDSVEALIDDVDAGFGAIVQTDDGSPRTIRENPASPARSPSGGLSNARELFLQLATTHVRHVRDFMIDLKAGQATAEWLSLCEPAMQSVRKMAEQLELRELTTALEAYVAALKLASESSGLVVDEESRTKLMAAYEPLVTLLPPAFALDAVKSKREGIIVRSLLTQVAGVGKVTLDKLFSSGLSTLDSLFHARPEEIASITGIESDIAAKISERFTRYKKELQSTSLDEERTAERARLAELVDELERQQRAFEVAEKDEDAAQKRVTRKGREKAFLEIKVLLARLGEVERIAAIDKMAFVRKVADLRKFLGG